MVKKGRQDTRTIRIYFTSSVVYAYSLLIFDFGTGGLWQIYCTHREAEAPFLPLALSVHQLSFVLHQSGSIQFFFPFFSFFLSSPYCASKRGLDSVYREKDQKILSSNERKIFLFFSSIFSLGILKEVDSKNFSHWSFHSKTEQWLFSSVTKKEWKRKTPTLKNTLKKDNKFQR